MDDDTLSRIRTAINAEIAELRENSDKHSHEVQTNAIMIAEGLQRALRIVEEIFLKDGDSNGDESDEKKGLLQLRREEGR